MSSGPRSPTPPVVRYVDDEQLADLRVTRLSVKEGSVDDFDEVSDDRADDATLVWQDRIEGVVEIQAAWPLP